MMKKWKCTSMTPPERWTKIPEAATRPSAAITDCRLRPNSFCPARTAATATMAPSASEWRRPLPLTAPKMVRPTAWHHRMRMTTRWRRSHWS